MPILNNARCDRLLGPAVVLALFIVPTAGCSLFGWPRRSAGPKPPVAFTQTPSLDQIVATVNGNTDKIQRLQATGASLSVPGAPHLRTTLAMERPGRFRLQAGTGLTGTELDLGSNDELFWVWAKRNNPPAVFYSRHDQFANSAARTMFPVEPRWLSEALGLVRFDPAFRHEGPYAVRQGQLEIRSTINSSSGPMTKVTSVDDRHGWVLSQHVYDQAGRRLASAVATDHRYDPAAGVTLPHRVDVQLPPSQLAFTIDVAAYVVNRLDADPAQLWAMPQLDGYDYVDLADPNLRLPGQTPPPSVSQRQPAYPPTGYNSPAVARLRGYDHR